MCHDFPTKSWLFLFFIYKESTYEIEKLNFKLGPTWILSPKVRYIKGVLDPKILDPNPNTNSLQLTNYCMSTKGTYLQYLPWERWKKMIFM